MLSTPFFSSVLSISMNPLSDVMNTKELTGGSVDNAYSGELGGMMAVNGKNIIIINTMTLIRKTGQTSGKACMAVSVNAIWCWMICLN